MELTMSLSKKKKKITKMPDQKASFSLSIDLGIGGAIVIVKKKDSEFLHCNSQQV